MINWDNLCLFLSFSFCILTFELGNHELQAIVILIGMLDPTEEHSCFFFLAKPSSFVLSRKWIQSALSDGQRRFMALQQH